MAAGSVSVGLGAGAHKAVLPIALTAGDEVALLASARECLKNGQPAGKHGFFQYSAAGDSKHPVSLEDKKSARLLFRFQEMQEGEIMVWLAIEKDSFPWYALWYLLDSYKEK